MAERAPENRVSGIRSTMEKWVEGKLNKAFLHFLAKNFLTAYLMIFQSETYIAKNWQKMKKIIVQLAFNPLFG